MSEFIENPFYGIWENFDVEELKEKVTDIIDKTYVAESSTEMIKLLCNLDELIAEFVAVIQFKGEKDIEMIKVEDLPKAVRKTLGIDGVGLESKFVPKNMIPPELLPNEEKSLKKTSKKLNDWLL